MDKFLKKAPNCNKAALFSVSRGSRGQGQRQKWEFQPGGWWAFLEADYFGCKIELPFLQTGLGTGRELSTCTYSLRVALGLAHGGSGEGVARQPEEEK